MRGVCAAAALTVALLCAPAAQAAPAPAEVEGQVLSRRGIPVPEAQLVLLRAAPVESTVRSRGYGERIARRRIDHE